MNVYNQEALSAIESLIADYLGAKTYLKHITTYEDTEIDTGEVNKLFLYEIKGPVLEEYPKLEKVLVLIVKNEVAFIDIYTGCSIPLASMTKDELKESKDSIFTMEYDKIKEIDVQSVLNYLG